MLYTVFETPTFTKTAETILTAEEKFDFINWISANPLSGVVIPGTGGLRKIRWKRSGMGSRGDTRIIYYNLVNEGEIWLLIAYTKSKFDNLPMDFLKYLKATI